MKEKFKITCLECGSENVSIETNVEYDYEESPYLTGNYYLQCHNCGNDDM